MLISTQSSFDSFHKNVQLKRNGHSVFDSEVLDAKKPRPDGLGKSSQQGIQIQGDRLTRSCIGDLANVSSTEALPAARLNES
jgi:hypothetical protein